MRTIRALLVGWLLIVATDALAGPAVILDQTFADADWTIVTLTVGAGGFTEAVQDADGIPGPSRRVRVVVNAAPSPTEFSAIYGVHLFSGTTYDPQTQGAIANVDYYERALLVTGFGDGQATGIALRQAGEVYIRQVGVTPDRLWTQKQATGVLASGFVHLVQGGSDAAQPDFSTAGGPIEFGFYRADSTSPGANGYEIVASIDDWTVLVNPPCAGDGACMYGDGCFTGACVEGACRATPAACDDGDACTTDLCVDGACAALPVVCDDGNACTADACSAGTCVAPPIDCDDGVPCTVDACSAGACTHSTAIDSVESAIDALLTLLETPPCAGDGLAAKTRKKLVKKLAKANKKLARADAVTKARLVSSLLGAAGRLLDVAARVVGKASTAGIVTPECAAALTTFLAGLDGCVATLGGG
jgi:hypothetical protein